MVPRKWIAHSNELRLQAIPIMTGMQINKESSYFEDTKIHCNFKVSVTIGLIISSNCLNQR